MVEFLIAGVAEEVDAEIDPFLLQAVEHVLEAVKIARAELRPSGSVFAGHQQEIHPLKPHHIVPLTAHLRGELPDVLMGFLLRPDLEHRLLPAHHVIGKGVEREEADRFFRLFFKAESSIRPDHDPAVLPRRPRLMDSA